MQLDRRECKTIVLGLAMLSEPGEKVHAAKSEDTNLAEGGGVSSGEE